MQRISLFEYIIVLIII